jgi:hypothetical protein
VTGILDSCQSGAKCINMLHNYVKMQWHFTVYNGTALEVAVTCNLVFMTLLIDRPVTMCPVSSNSVIACFCDVRERERER